MALLKCDPENEFVPREPSEDELPKCEFSILETARFVETADVEPRELADSELPSAPRLPFTDGDVAAPRELPAKLEVVPAREPAFALDVVEPPRELANAFEVAPPRAPAVALDAPLRPKYGIEPLRPNEFGGVVALRLPVTPLRAEYELPRFAEL
ncbi:MAG: hypothetical protein WA197_18050 [Candidatus Acidiferrales bacterium]